MRDVQLWLRYQWDRALAVVAIVIGAVALLLGWLGASGTSHPAEQIPYVISGGLTGIFVLGVGVMLWLSADLRDNWRKLDELHLSRGEPEPERELEPQRAREVTVTGRAARKR